MDVIATRRELVILELEDRLSKRMAQAAATTKTFEKTLRDLDGTNVSASKSTKDLGDETAATGDKTKGATKATKEYTLAMAVADEKSARLKKSLRDQARAQLDAADGMDAFRKDADGAGREIDRFSGRLKLLADVALTLGPALVPLGGAAVVGVAGLAAQMGALAGGVGVAVAALNGLGDAVKAVNDYQLEPTADNLAKVQQEFERIGPAAADFVIFLETISPQLRELQMTAREGFLPGLEEGIDSFLERGPQVNTIVGELAEALGDLPASAGDVLAGDRFTAFFDYLDSEAATTLGELGRSIGLITEGLANMMVAFAPVSSDFSGGMEDMARSFAEWTAALDSNDSFQSFIDYIRTNGPRAMDFLGSLVMALASVVEAAAPIGAAIIPVLTTLLDLFAALAGTDLGSTVLAAAAAMAVYSRGAAAAAAVNTRLQASFVGVGTAAGTARASMIGMARSMGVIAAAMAAIQTGSNVWDSLGRSFEAGDKAAKTLTELESAIGESNLGKFAQDLGIDVQRLAQDLATSGTEGEYYQQVLEQLGGAADGFGGKVNALSDFIGPWIGDTEQASLANLDLGKIVRGNEGLLGSMAAETEDAGQAQLELAQRSDYAAGNLEKLRGRLQAARAELKESRQAARGVAESFVNLGDSLNDSDKSLGDWLSELEKNAQALRDFQRNAKEAGKKGLDQGLVKSLQNAGSEGALRMRQLANATDAEIERANGAWRRGQGAVKDFVKEVGGVKPKYVTKLEAQVEEAMADLARLRSQLNIPDEYVNVWVTTRKVNGGGMGPQETAAGGGTVQDDGGPYADRFPYLLAPREEVTSNRHGQADRYRPVLKAINANAPRAVIKGMLADGGTVRGLADGGTSNRGGIGPNSQLYGINSWLSAAELGLRIASLSQRQLADLGRDMERLGKGPLGKLSKAFDKATELADKELAASKERLEALRSERDSIAATVEARLKTADLFGQTSGGDYMQLNRPENWNELSPEAQRNFLDAEWSVNQSLGYGQTQSPVDILRADLARAREEREMIQQLKRRGLSGSALQYAIESEGGLEGALALSSKELNQFNRLYPERDRVAASVGNQAGMAVLGQELRAARREAREDREIAKAIRQEAKEANKLAAAMVDLAKSNPRETGEAVIKGVDKIAADGKRRQR